MTDPHAQQKFNMKQVHAAYNRFVDLYQKKHPATTGTITDCTYTISGKRGY